MFKKLLSRKIPALFTCKSEPSRRYSRRTIYQNIDTTEMIDGRFDHRLGVFDRVVIGHGFSTARFDQLNHFVRWSSGVTSVTGRTSTEIIDDHTRPSFTKRQCVFLDEKRSFSEDRRPRPSLTFPKPFPAPVTTTTRPSKRSISEDKREDSIRLQLLEDKDARFIEHSKRSIQTVSS